MTTSEDDAAALSAKNADLVAAIHQGQSRQPTQRRYLVVADGILAAIGTGHLAAGDRLPTERQLAEICGASRTTVRDALLALELSGVVEVRPGSGCYVSSLKSPRRRTSSVMLDAVPRELLEARLHLEPAVAGICAEHLGAEAIADLRALVDRCESEGERGAPEDLGPFLTLSHEFHAELAARCGNSILADLTRQLVDVTAHPLWQVVNAMHVRSRETRAGQIAEHRAVIDAVERGDSAAAEAAMRLHLGGLESGIFGTDKPAPALRRQRRRSR